MKGERFTADTVIQNGIRALTGRSDSGYSKGVLAYDAWINALSDEKSFAAGDNYSVLFEKMLCQNDAMNCLEDGRSSAAAYFRGLSKSDENRKEKYSRIADAFERCSHVIREMRELYGNDMVKKLADPDVRKQTCELCERAKQADEEALSLLHEFVTL